MEKRIELITYNQRRMLPLAIIGIVVVTGVGFGGIALFREHKGFLVFGLSVAVLLGGVYGLLKLLKKLGSEPLVIDLNAAGLVIHNQKTGAEQRVAYDDIAAYRFAEYNQTEELRLTLKNAERIRISINYQVHDNQSLAELMQEFEQRLAMHQELQPGQAPVALREKTFFEKPIATVLLVIITVAMGWLAWKLYSSPRPVRANAFAFVGLYLTYVAPWYAARRRRTARA